MSAWTKDNVRSLTKIITLSNALFRPRVCPLRQPAMSPTNVLDRQDQEVLGLALGCLQNTLVEEHSCLSTWLVGKSVATFDELDGTYNGLTMWKHWEGGGRKIGWGVTAHALSSQMYELDLSR
jgi:hypothetical protein